MEFASTTLFNELDTPLWFPLPTGIRYDLIPGGHVLSEYPGTVQYVIIGSADPVG